MSGSFCQKLESLPLATQENSCLSSAPLLPSMSGYGVPPSRPPISLERTTLSTCSPARPEAGSWRSFRAL